MAVATHPSSSSVRPRDVLLVGAFVVGWSAGRAIPGPTVPFPAPSQRGRFGKPARLALAGVAAALAVTAIGLATRSDVAGAPPVSPAVAAQEQAQAATRARAARLRLLRNLELAGIAARRVGAPDPPAPRQLLAAHTDVTPSARAVALDTYVQAVGADTILRGLDASRDQLQQQVLHDPRVHIYSEGIGDVTSGRLDVRVLAIIEYLAQADGEVSVSCLIAGHSLYVAGRPGVVSAHIYGRAVDISAVGNTPILGHQGPGTITEKAIEQVLSLAPSVEPVQVISLMSLGGPSFALADHYDHIHLGY